jgi:hypothetical protein
MHGGENIIWAAAAFPEAPEAFHPPKRLIRRPGAGGRAPRTINTSHTRRNRTGLGSEPAMSLAVKKTEMPDDTAYKRKRRVQK